MQINGILEYVYRLPGLTCAACGATYGGSRILSISAPPQIRNDQRFMSRWPISEVEHAALQQELAGYLEEELISFVTFRPGDNFQPAYLDIPSKPTADFLWPNIRSFVVSERMKNMVFDELLDDVEIAPVQMRKVGKRPSAIPVSDTPGAAQYVELSHTNDSIGTYYQILVRSESDYPTGGRPVSTCPLCKHKSIDDEKRELIMKEEMWSGQQIFFLKTTLHVVVTESLVEKIKSVQASNVDFIPY
ncbi:MAG: hypothetical protein PHG00_02025 [Methylococcales bacterium]|nr:hypothetical protein [Methylococcales bacterium]